MSNDKGDARLNKRLLIPTMAIVGFVAIPMILYSQHPQIQNFIKYVYEFTSKSFGWAYVLLYLVFGCFMFFIALSPYGKIKLGGPNASPKYSYFHWASMIIAAGHGIGLINWVMVEPLVTNAMAPLGAGYNKAFTYEVAGAYTFFHWGPFYWVLFLVASVPIFYFLGVRQRNKQCVSVTIEPLLGKNKTNSFWGVLFDVFIILALAGGIGTTLTLAVQLVSGLFAEIVGIEGGRVLQLSALALFTAITLVSLSRPVSKGMRVLSDANSILALLLLALVVIGGPTSFFFNMMVNMLGTTFDIFPRISGWTDPFMASGYPQEWTIFYGAWTYAYAPMMGIFFTSISMGRTLRETILGIFFFGCLSSFLFCNILGGFTLYVQYEGIFDTYSYYLATGKSLPLTVSKVLSLLPFAKFFAPAFLLMCTIFLTTTIDASTRVLAAMTTKSMYAGQEPAVFSKLTWCIALSLLVLGLLLVGGLPVVQALCVLSAIPLVVLGVVMNLCMWKSMREDFPGVRNKNILYYTSKVEPRNPVLEYGRALKDVSLPSPVTLRSTAGHGGPQ